MIAQTPWIERRFSFDFPVGLFPTIVERLVGTPMRAEELTRGAAPQVLTRRVDNKWSPQEHLGHLIDLEELHDGRIDDFLARAPVLRSWDTTNRKTSDANHNSRPLADILKELGTVRRDFVARLVACDEATLSITSLHPRLKVPMRLVDMAYFVAEHDDHHLARVRTLI